MFLLNISLSLRYLLFLNILFNVFSWMFHHNNNPYIDLHLFVNILYNVSKTTSSNSLVKPHAQQFHTGRPNYNPLTKIPFLLFVRPLISLVGNILTRLWKRLDPDKKSRIKDVTRKFKLLLPLFGILSFIGVYLYYQQNVEEVDILGVKRKRFMILRTNYVWRGKCS